MILFILGVAAALQLGPEASLPIDSPSDQRRAAFASYWSQIATNAAPRFSFAVDASVSKSGCDAYRVDERDGALAFRGSNERSLWYALYDFFGRHGCRWYWDGDKLPEKGNVDVRGTAITEESRFEYRGIRYFAHRGLHRFQAEHWGPEDWRREIDWCVKNRLNVLMLRIGMDDTWQKAFPDIVPYPDAAKPLPGALAGYDNRSLFWPLEYRGKLRKALTDYALSRGLEVPTDFGTMTHWYSRTPVEYLAAKKPPFLPQATKDYGEETGLVWDIRKPGWMDEYWKLTEAQLAAGYGGSNLLHTIGFGERRVFTNRAENLAFKIKVNKELVDLARAKRPNAKVLLAGWDFFYSWTPEEVRELIPQLDPKTTILWDYEADAPGEKNFTNWGVVGKFPYTFSIFLTFEMGLDIRANYKLIEERFAAAKDDPMCKGFIFWPESAHTDTLLLDYFAANAWRPRTQSVEARISDFCRARYGRDAAVMEKCWKAVLPVSTMLGYWGNAPMILLGSPADVGWIRREIVDLKTYGTDAAKLKAASEVFARLAKVDLADARVRRDAFDLARTFADRLLIDAQVRLGEAKDGADIRAAATRFERLWERFADLLAQHEDCSMAESLAGLGRVAPVRNPEAWKVLLDNANNGYCRSHQYELAAAWYLPFAREVAAAYRASAKTGQPVDGAALKARAEVLRKALYEKGGLAALTHATRRPRTPENLAAVLNDWVAELEEAPTVRVDCSKALGPVKPVNGVGQGPLLGWVDTRLFSYLGEAGVPFARLHDVGGPFGGNRLVDVPNIFRDFDADENDPKNYDFRFTDLYLKALIDNGVEPVYRLGVTIENCASSVGTLRVDPPKDCAKWARVCEHIVRHYTRGWANGFNWKIRYWEIWNEPEDVGGKRRVMWTGTFRQYCELYEVTSKLLKSKYPELKIGGYGACGFYSVYGDMGSPAQHARYESFTRNFDEFLAFVKKRNCPFDFFSYHVYDSVENFLHYIDYPRRKLDAAGFKDTEISLNEWLTWNNRPGSAEQAAFVGAMMIEMQRGPVDTAMLYDGRCQISSCGPLFKPLDYGDPDYTHDNPGAPRKAYWALVYFNELRKLGTAVACDARGSGLHAVAATNGGDDGALFLANDSSEHRWLKLDFGGWAARLARMTDKRRTDAYTVDFCELPPHSIKLIRMTRRAASSRVTSSDGVSPTKKERIQ